MSLSCVAFFFLEVRAGGLWILDKYMEETFVPFRGIKNDLDSRLKCYKEDWYGGFRSGIR